MLCYQVCICEQRRKTSTAIITKMTIVLRKRRTSDKQYQIICSMCPAPVEFLTQHHGAPVFPKLQSRYYQVQCQAVGEETSFINGGQMKKSGKIREAQSAVRKFRSLTFMRSAFSATFVSRTTQRQSGTRVAVL